LTARELPALRCRSPQTDLVSAPRLNTGNHSSPTAARYARISPSDEAKRKAALQRSYETLRFPEGVKHEPGAD
jgi:hypothetical protein